MTSTKEQIEALHMAYQDAVSRKDYLTCDKLRLEIRRVTTGRKFQIKIDSDLNLM